MSVDNDLKLTLQKVVSHAVLRMEFIGDTNTKRSIYQEYKEWLGSSIDDWVLDLPEDWAKFDEVYY